MRARVEFPEGRGGRCVLRQVDGPLSWSFKDACYALAYVATHAALQLDAEARDVLTTTAHDLLGMGVGR